MLKIQYKGNSTFALLDAAGKEIIFSIAFAVDSTILNIGAIATTFATLDKCVDAIEEKHPKSGLKQLGFLRAVAENLNQGTFEVRHAGAGVYSIFHHKGSISTRIGRYNFYECLLRLDRFLISEAAILGYIAIAFKAYRWDIGVAEFVRTPSIGNEMQQDYRTYDEAIAALKDIQSYLEKPLSDVFKIGLKSWSNLADWWACKVDELRVFVRAKKFPTTMSEFADIAIERSWGKGEKCACQTHLDSVVAKELLHSTSEIINRYELNAKSTENKCKYTMLVEMRKEHILRNIDAALSISTDWGLDSFNKALVHLHTDLILFSGLVSEQAQAAFMNNSAKK